MITEENKLGFTQKYNLRYSEMDYNRLLKPSSLLNFLQDMASDGAEKFNFGYSFVSAHNYAWFLLKYRMEFVDYPHALDELIFKTEARGHNKLFANRDFEIFTVENKLVARISSIWGLIDLNGKTMLQPGQVFSYMPKIEKRQDDLSFQKIKSIERVDFEKLFQVRFDDIDVNRHVNNANYIVWAFEALPYEFKSKYKIKTLDMVYKKEIAYGHNVVSQVEFDKEKLTSVHVVKNQDTGEDLCFVCAKFVEI